jgi:putative exosortase-associated protein (TIGR04073 family)
MAKQKICSTRLTGFSGVKAYRLYVEVLKKYCNAVDRTFCDAIKFRFLQVDQCRLVLYDKEISSRLRWHFIHTTEEGFMRKKILLVATVLMTLLAVIATPVFASRVDNKDYISEVVEPEPYLEKAAYKLLRGITNMVTCPGEIPKQIVITTIDRGAIGPVLGLIKGIGMTSMRAILGATETLLFMAPNSLDSEDFDPILKPEFVWNPSTRTGH